MSAQPLSNPAVDFVIPVYNEKENIVSVLDSLKQNIKAPFRVLICYDQDGDTTWEALKGYTPGDLFEIIPVKNKYGRGPHGAVLSGFEASLAPAVLVIPADDDYNAARFQKMIEKFHEGYDIVCASRFMSGGCMIGCPWLKATLVRTSAFFLKHLVFLPTHDPSNGLRLFSRRVITQIQIESRLGFTYSIELLVKTHRLGWKIAEIPVHWYERKKGQSRFRVMKWLWPYLQWVLYAVETTYLRRGPESVKLKALSV